MKLRRKSRGFSLVEVVLALGVAAFALMAVLGLLSVAINSGKEAADDTMLVSMSNNLLATWRGKPFAEIPLESNPAANLPPGTTVTTDIYFDENGVRLMDAAGNDLERAPALAAGAIYKCKTKIQGDVPTATGAQVNLLRIELCFQWPAMAPIPPNQKTVHASIARF